MSKMPDISTLHGIAARIASLVPCLGKEIAVIDIDTTKLSAQVSIPVTCRVGPTTQAATGIVDLWYAPSNETAPWRARVRMNGLEHTTGGGDAELAFEYALRTLENMANGERNPIVPQ